MRLVLHAGMNKAGSTSIQSALFHATGVNFRYLDAHSFHAFDFGTGHNPFFLIAFGDIDAFVRRRALPETARPALARLRGHLLGAFHAQAAATDRKTLVVSAEELSMPGDSIDLEVAAAELGRDAEEILVVVYVRRPISHLQSTAHQLVRQGLPLRLDRKWPHYRRRFEKLERVFGRSALRYRLYDRNALHGGDVVADFVETAGLEGEIPRNVRKNVAMSLETLALLLEARERRMPRAEIRRLERALAGYGERRFALDRKLAERLIAAHSKDIDWMASRLPGFSADPEAAAEDGIRDEAQLRRIAARNSEAAERFIQRAAPPWRSQRAR